MNNKLQLNLNNPEQFPLLNSLNEDLEKLIPGDLLFLDSLYMARDRNYLRPENVALFKPILNELKIRLTDTRFSILGGLIKELKRERDNYLGLNITASDQRNYAMEIYNGQVIERVKIFQDVVFSMIIKIFRDLVGANEAALQKTNLSYCLEVWLEEFLINKGAGKPAAKTKKILTYDWTGKPQNLTVLHKAMKEAFIDNDTKVKDFCNIFGSLNTTEIKPVKWIRSPTELLQFLYEMMKAGLIAKGNSMSYQRLKACFCKEDGSQFNEALRSIFEQIKKGYTPEKTDIKKLVKSIK